MSRNNRRHSVGACRDEFRRQAALASLPLEGMILRKTHGGTAHTLYCMVRDEGGGFAFAPKPVGSALACCRHRAGAMVIERMMDEERKARRLLDGAMHT